MRKDKLEDYELFYVQIPQQVDDAQDDGLPDTPITDLHETLDSEESRGLSHDQASELAKDMKQAKPLDPAPPEAHKSDQNDLFNS